MDNIVEFKVLEWLIGFFGISILIVLGLIWLELRDINSNTRHISNNTYK